jgi:hypothetical protein
MKPVTLFLRSLGLASLLFAGAVSSHAQSCVTDGAAAKTETTRYENEENSIKDAETQASVDYDNAKLLCKKSQTVTQPKATGCLVDAQRKYQDAQIANGDRRCNNNATRAKANIDIQAAADECAVTGPTPADQQENVRHLRAMVDIKKKVVDANNTYDKGKLGCVPPPAPPDSKPNPGWEEANPSKGTCLKQVEKTYTDTQVDIQIASNTENATHAKNQRNILKNAQQPQK